MVKLAKSNAAFLFFEFLSTVQPSVHRKDLSDAWVLVRYFILNRLTTSLWVPWSKKVTDVSPEVSELIASAGPCQTRPMLPAFAISRRNCQPGSMLRSLPPRARASATTCRQVLEVADGQAICPFNFGLSKSSTVLISI